MITEALELPGPLAGKKAWIGLAVIALPCMLYSMDLTVLNLALPQIIVALHPTATELLWIVDVYGFMLSGFLITMGTLGDRIGRKRLLLIGAFAFGCASALAAFSNSPLTLILARALLGVAGATLAPSTLSLIRNMFTNSNERTIAFGIWVTSFSVGGAIGPLAGGLLLAYFWWGSVFLIGVPIMLLLIVVGPFLLPEYKEDVSKPIDLLSLILSLCTIFPVIFGLKRLAVDGLNGVSLAGVVLGLLSGWVFYKRQGKISAPLIDFSLFKAASFSAALAIYTFSAFVVFGFFLFTFQCLQLVIGLNPLQAGVLSLPFSVAFIVGSSLAPQLTRRFKPKLIIATGLMATAVGFCLLTQLDNFHDRLPILIIGGTLNCLGIAPVLTLATDIMVSGVNPEKSGIASSISETGSELGGALGIALLGTIGTAVYRFQMPVGFKETIAETLTKVKELPAGQEQMIARQAIHAFSSGMQVSAMVCVGVVIVLIWISLTKIA